MKKGNGVSVVGDRKGSGVLGIVGLLAGIIGLFFLRGVLPRLANMILVIGGILLLLLVILVVVVMVLAFKQPKGTTGKPTATDISNLLSKGRASLMEIRRLAMRLKNQQIRTTVDDICKEADKILRTVKEQPENMSDIRQFLNYYLPTLGTILLKYVRMEESGLDVGDMDQKVLACMQDIRTAMDKQYSNLFEDDRFDLTVEMESLKIACRRDGLLVEEETELEDNGRRITLTL